MKTKYTVIAGRVICEDGQPLVTIGKCDGTSPTAADALTHTICALLNAAAEIERARSSFINASRSSK